tara:strand:- start:1341 stop:1763 length:423 start_codon:yes stop_codon:yes gene_type:complete
MNIIPFEAEHVKLIKLQDKQLYLNAFVTMEQAEALEEHTSYSAEVDGQIIASSGIIPMWHGRGMAWAFLSEMGPRHFMGVHKAIKRALDNCYIQRIEITVDCDFPQAYRWANLLGFTMEAECMRAYTPDGRDCALFARVL